MKIKKVYEKNVQIDFDEDWEDIEENPEYIFLKSLYDFMNKGTLKKTVKFLKIANDLCKMGEISKETISEFVENEGIDKSLVKKSLKKLKKPHFNHFFDYKHLILYCFTFGFI